MKKICTCVSLALLLTLSGCKDATTSLSDGNEALITLGKDTITKNDVYEGLKNRNGVTAVISKATAFIIDKEVPVTDDMKKEAKEELAAFKKAIGDENFKNYLKNMGYTEQQFLDENVMTTVRTGYLSKNYVADNYDAINEKYEIRKVQVFHTTDNSVAAEVQKKVSSGELTIEEAVKKYDGKTSDFTGKEQIITNAAGLSSDIWENILKVKEDNTLLDVHQYSSDLKNFYVIKVVSVNVPYEEAKDSIEGLRSIGDEAFAYYLKKYNFTVYDIDLYNGIKANNESYLVQDNK